jgi:hypothetical protein
MQTTDVLGQFDALDVLAQDTGAVDAWIPTNRQPNSRWWIQKGRPVVTDVAAARDVTPLAELAFAFETWAPRLA